MCVEMDDASENLASVNTQPKCPLSMWTEDILAHSRLSIDEDIRPSYLILLQEADERVF